jgi:3-oxoacyl-[acyl-carrier-protein] synthase III
MPKEPIPASMVSLALRLPARVITNDFLRERYPDVVRTSEERALGKLWRPDPGSTSARFDAAAEPYLQDPFRGCVTRHWLEPGERSIDLEEPAARSALAAAGLTPADVDLLLCSSFFPDQLDVGNAAFLARRLGIQAPAWNLESACASSVIALETASALVASGLHRNVLCVTSCTYSRISREEDTLGWGNGDGAAAFVVRPTTPPAGMLAWHSMSTNVTCGAIYSTFERAEDGSDRIEMKATPEAGRLLRETAEPFLTTCVTGVLDKADMSLEDIELFVFNTPTAWYAQFCCDVLGVSVERSVNAHSEVANVGPVLMPANLHKAVREGRARPGALVLLYAVGSVSNASASILRLPEIQLGE